MDLTLKGVVKKLAHSHGTIYSTDYQESFFFLRSSITIDDRYIIKKGDKVSFELRTNRVGRPEACKISLFISSILSTSKSENINIAEIFKLSSFDNQINKFKSFISDGFVSLGKSSRLNELIKVIVHDNYISEIERKFLEEKTIELNLSKNLVNKAEEYLFSNNPYFDNILNIIFEDGLIKENELAFLFEKAEENSFSPSSVNNRFWQYGFSLHLEDLLKIESLPKIIRLWNLSQNENFQLALNKDWLILQLNIFKSSNIEKNLDRALKIFEDEMISFLNKKYNYVFDISDLYRNQNQNSNTIIESKATNSKFVKGKSYKKVDIFSILEIPENQQKGKWNNGYSNKINNWFILAENNHKFSDHTISDEGIMDFQAIDSKIKWDSNKSLKKSNPFIFARTPFDPKNYWEYIGQGLCLMSLDTFPIKYKWEIVDNIKTVNRPRKLDTPNTGSIILKKDNEIYWNEKFVQNNHKTRILELIYKDEIFNASQEYLNLAHDNGKTDPSLVMNEFEKVYESLTD